jgi:hypothetical protein
VNEWPLAYGDGDDDWRQWDADAREEFYNTLAPTLAKVMDLGARIDMKMLENVYAVGASTGARLMIDAIEKDLKRRG